MEINIFILYLYIGIVLTVYLTILREKYLLPLKTGAKSRYNLE